ncbi:MAG TPA: hypothetical protein VI318_06955 [Baekduia sp.]
MLAPATAPPRRLRLLVFKLLALAVALSAVLAVAFVVLFRGGVSESYNLPGPLPLAYALRADAPKWTRPCWDTPRLTAEDTCAHVSGRVVWVQGHDPDNDGDRHLVIIDQLRPRIVKLPPGLYVPRLPRIGARVEVIGWQTQGGSGNAEVDTQRLLWGGHVWLTVHTRAEPGG